MDAIAVSRLSCSQSVHKFGCLMASPGPLFVYGSAVSYNRQRLIFEMKAITTNCSHLVGLSQVLKLFMSHFVCRHHFYRMN